MSSVPETYLYEVRPVGRPIVLGHGVEITARKSLYLTKEDVLKCLETAYVYRRFSLREPERVTVANIDRVHRQVYIPESEWVNYQEMKEDKSAEEEPINNSEPLPTLSTEAEESNTVVEVELAEEATEPESEEIEVQEEVEPETTDAVVEVEEDDEIAEVELATEEVIDATDLVEEDNESGDLHSESTQQPSQPKQGKYTYNKKHKKH